MRRTRIATALATACAVSVLGVGADAAPKPVCNLVTDPAGDATSIVGPPTPVNDPDQDILSYDVATKGKKITAVIRLAALDTTDRLAPFGRFYWANFTVAGKALYLDAFLDSSGVATFSDGPAGPPTSGLGAGRTYIAPVQGVVDLQKKEIRMTAPESDFAKLATFKPGKKITGLDAQTHRFLGYPGLGGGTPITDEASSNASYTIDKPSCVKVGS